jgi:DNA-binding LacI/PurR family transcriptional regulator
MATLRQVAAHAGVSLATAWRVAANADSVRLETRERVERAMRALLYTPTAPRPATGMIGLLVPELANPIFPAFAQAIEMRAAEVGLSSILCNTTGATYREVDYVHTLLDHRVEGMIFVSCEMTNLRGEHGHYAQLAREGARLVFVNGAISSLDVPSVGVDERLAGEIATRHLIELGHERIGFIGGPEHYLPTRLKLAGRASALQAAGLDPERLVAHAEFSVEGGRAALASLLSRSTSATGVACSSDVMAIGAMLEAHERGIRVPEQLSIVGFDGIEATTWTRPELTTVEQPIVRIADAAVQALRQLIGDADARPASSYFAPTLKVRKSTAPPA